jgi:hypothetical protein
LLQVCTSPNFGLTVLSSGYVGIGTTNPNVLFQVGTPPNSGLTVLGNGNVGIGHTMPYALLVVGSGVTKGIVVTAGGFVGIGTSTPQNEFEIDTHYGANSGTTFVSNAGSVAFGSITAAVPYNSSYPIEIRNAGSPMLWNTTQLDWITSSGTPTINIRDGGTNFVIYVLDSSLRQNEYNFGQQGNFTCGTMGGGSARDNARLGVSAKSNAATEFVFRIQNSAGADKLCVKGDGNVGIGVTAPICLFETRGAANTNLFELDDGTRGLLIQTMLGQNNVGLLGFFNAAWNNLDIRATTGVGTGITVATGGNIGIGITSPTTKVVIVGSSSAPAQSLMLRAGVGSTAGGSRVVVVAPGGSCFSCGSDDAGTWACRGITCP